MTTETNFQEEAQKIWAQLDAEDSGQKVVEPAETTEVADDGSAATAAQEASDTQPTSDGQSEQQPEEDDPKVLRTKIAGLESMLNQLAGRVRNAEGHIGGINSQMKQRLEAAKTVVASGGDAPTAREIQAAQASPEAFAALEKEYPEFAKAMKPLQDAIDSRLAAIERGQTAKPQPTQEAVPSNAVSQDDLVEANRKLKVEIRHPGWEQLVKTAEFHGWYAQAPLEIKMLASGDEPESAIRLLDLYAESRKASPQAQRNSRRFESAAALPTGTRSSVKTKQVDEMSGDEYWRYLDQIDKQKA